MTRKSKATRWMLLAAFLGSMAIGSSVVVAAEDDGPSFEVVDAESIYFGSGLHPQSPGVMRADDVWHAIPEYKQIIADELTEDDPKYHLLMLKATERFNQALRMLARRDAHDMLGEVGAIVSRNGGAVPDVTEEMVKLVSRG